jgi:hypothetical protein
VYKDSNRHQACSKGIWDNAIPDGIKRRVESDECSMGASPISARSVLSILAIEKKGFDVIFQDG